MAISSYSELQAAIVSWMARSGDGELTSEATTFIALAESRLNRDLPLRVMEVDDTSLTGTVSSREVALPSDYVEPKALFLTTYGDERWLRPFIAGSGPHLTYLSENAAPTAWAINGANIDLDSPCDQAHTFRFRYRKSFALSGSETTNWLLTNHPDVYLSACLVEGYQFMQDVEKTPLWEARYRSNVADVKRKEARSKQATLVVDPGLLNSGGFDINTGGWR